MNPLSDATGPEKVVRAIEVSSHARICSVVVCMTSAGTVYNTGNPGMTSFYPYLKRVSRVLIKKKPPAL